MLKSLLRQMLRPKHEVAPPAALMESRLRSALGYQNSGRPAEAEAIFRAVLEETPLDGDVMHLLAINLMQQRRHNEAVALLERVISLQTEHVEAQYNLAGAQLELGKYGHAALGFERVLELRPDFVEALSNLGNTLQATGRLDEAERSYRRALELRPDFADAEYNLGTLLQRECRRAEAISCYEKVLSLKPDYADAHHALIHMMNQSAEDDGAAVFAQCRRFAEQFENGLAQLTHRNNRSPERRLKVGYVSGDFREHSVAYFIEPVLANHDHQIAEVFCYSNHRQIDHVTRRLMGYSNHWRSIEDLSDDKAAALIQQDGIDILVDLSGHTSHNRLLVFARKPAPVQVTWIGLPSPTGLSAMDYRLTNRYTDPVGMNERYRTETLIRLSSSACFQPEAQLPPVNELPALANGYVTFSSFNNPQKITPAAFELWSRILALLPDSRLMMLCPASFRDHVNKEFAARGVGAERLIFVERLPAPDYLALHGKVDIALDPFPYNGGTTTRNSLWMGVPVVTLAGKMPVSRVGSALMSQVGLEAFIAKNAEEYAQIALRWARDLEGLSRVRSELRRRVQLAPFSNAKACIRELEAAYRQMWRTWCARQGHG